MLKFSRALMLGNIVTGKGVIISGKGLAGAGTWISYECYIFLGGSRNTIVEKAVRDIRWLSLKIWYFYESLVSV